MTLPLPGERRPGPPGSWVDLVLGMCFGACLALLLQQLLGGGP